MAFDLNENSSVNDVFEWLNSNGFAEFSEIFQDEGIDGEAFCCLTENALGSLVKKVGPRMKLLKVIKQMKDKDCSISVSTCSSPSTPSSNIDETDVFHSTMLPADSPSSSPSICNVPKKWKSPFPLPERFPPSVQEALNQGTFLGKQLRCKFVQTVYDRICLFTISPTPDQRREVCREIITKYPFLADAGGGYEIWYRQIGDKVKNEIRNEKTDPIVLARKRKNVQGSPQPPKHQAVRRGIVNWEPPAIDGEDEQSSKAHTSWMQKEKKKKQWNISLIEKKMELTYSFRRRMLNEGKLPLKRLKELYPFLFEKNHLRKEYNRLMAEETASDRIQSNLLSIAPKIISVAKGRNLAAKEAQALLELYDKGADEDEIILSGEDKAYIAVCLLPYLLEKTSKKTPDPQSFLYQIGDDASMVSKKTKCDMSPFLIICGSIVDPEEEMTVARENQLLLNASGILEAVEMMLMVYYVCNMAYPKECLNTYLFLQRSVLKVFDSQKLPTKVLILLSELNAL